LPLSLRQLRPSLRQLRPSLRRLRPSLRWLPLSLRRLRLSLRRLRPSLRWLLLSLRQLRPSLRRLRPSRRRLNLPPSPRLPQSNPSPLRIPNPIQTLPRSSSRRRLREKKCSDPAAGGARRVH